MKEVITKSEKETFELGVKIAQSLKGGEVIGLVGNLGAGKTIFTKGIAKGFGIKKIINSPTFVIMKVYKVKSQSRVLGTKVNCLIHIDAYRLKSANDLIAIGAEEYFGKPDSVVIIEWADKIKKILPKNTIFYNFKISSDLRFINNN